MKAAAVQQVVSSVRHVITYCTTCQRYCVSWDLGCLRYLSPGCIITSGRYKFSIIFIFSINCIDSLKDNKAPGNDGITGEFYKCFKQVVAPFLAGLFEEALDKEELPHTLRQRLIKLIPKQKKDELNIENWRPIGLLNNDAKLFALIFVKRIKIVLADIIDEVYAREKYCK